MTMSIEIPADIQPLVKAAVAEGRYADEQELVSEILKVAVPALEGYEQLRRDVDTSLDMIERGEIREADFNSVRQRLCDEYEESGNSK